VLGDASCTGVVGSGVPVSVTSVGRDTCWADFDGCVASLAHRPGMSQQKNFIRLRGSA
jgi:hypothetical protein